MIKHKLGVEQNTWM